MIDENTSLRAKIKSSNSNVVVSTGEKFIEVEVEIYADEVVIETKRFGFPIDTPVEKIKTDIKNLLGNMRAENLSAIVNEENEKVEKIIETTVSELADSEITE